MIFSIYDTLYRMSLEDVSQGVTSRATSLHEKIRMDVHIIVLPIMIMSRKVGLRGISWGKVVYVISNGTSF